MDYKATLDFLFTRTPMFQSAGATAYKPGLDTVRTLSAALGNPHNRFRTIHVGGTNGKGSTAHTLAAILQSAGYRVGLFTSPHLVDFRERIRVNGKMISEQAVIDFVEKVRNGDLMECHPSFFEITTVMAFDYFARMDVDIAVIEVGLGGRLDSTNIISPILSIITNISLDHTALLGHTCEAIAAEKAGIIKAGVPVVIGESQGAVREVFRTAAASHGSPLSYADDLRMYDTVRADGDTLLYTGTPWGDIAGELTGDCQNRNTSTILCAVANLQRLGLKIGTEAVRGGFRNVCSLTGLMGRWMKVGDRPAVICDTGHNTGGWKYLSQRMSGDSTHWHIVIGFVNDKDVSGILAMLPAGAKYYFVKPSVERGLDATTLKDLAAAHDITGNAYDSVASGYNDALSHAGEGDTVFVGGSTFVVADLMAFIG